MAKSMRHLIVPSRETSLWRDKLSANGWLSKGYGIHNLDDYRGIPLNETAPENIEGLEITELEPISSGPQHWTNRLDNELFQQYRDYWPMSHDQVGDVIIVKIPDQIIQFSKNIGEAMLEQHSSARIVCADNGVKGEFRVRELTTLATRGGESTKTKVREHGNEFWIDPSLVYYSPRLATERLENLETVKQLSEKLGRRIDVCDPYAGVGPALVPLAKMTEHVDKIYASDLNPHAAELLEENLSGHNINCVDARTLSSTHSQCCDLLLVNLPHESIEHLPDLLGLLKKGHEVAIRGWAILPTNSLEDAEKQIRHHLAETQIVSLSINQKKSYSSDISYVGIDVYIIRS
jgi:tRNA (guanine37-N1)-methyltransferase